MTMTDCRHFSGYKPCGKNDQCSKSCPEYKTPSQRILIIGLGAMGAVLRATSILAPLVRKYPGCEIHWITEKQTKPLLENNPLIDSVFGLEFNDLLKLEALHFNLVVSIDKDLRVGGLLGRLSFDSIVGFLVDSRAGAIIPANPEAEELWSLGLNDHKKFFENKKSECQLMTEAFQLGPWQGDSYVCQLSKNEKEVSRRRRQQWSPHKFPLIGINTGCSPTIPYKKLGEKNHIKLIQNLLQKLPGVGIVLLGGPEDIKMNQMISAATGVINSSCNKGLRDGLCSVEACDIVISGDSLGMHMAIARKKHVVAWFGPTCAHEIELFGRGEKVITQATCSPCWKRVCEKTSMCYDQVSISEIVSAVERGLNCISLSSKPHSLEISF